jgi:putative redox protein
MSDTQVRVKWLEGSFSLGLAGKHTVGIDRLASVGGTEAGFRASELLLLSLGGCLSSTLVGAAKARELTLSKVDIQVVGKTVPNPERIGEIEVEVDLAITDAEGVELAGSELDRILDIAERGCFVTNTLRTGIAISVKRAGSEALLVH